MGLIEQFVSDVSAKDEMSKRQLERDINQMDDKQRVSLADIINFFCKNGISVEAQADSYLFLVNDYREYQMFLLREDRYKYSTYVEVAADVYNNIEYMDNYVCALALSKELWYNHRIIDKWMLDKLSSQNKNGGGYGGSYLEVGPGHGRMFAYAVKNLNCARYMAVDISESSVIWTKRYLDYVNRGESKQEKQPDVRCQDFLELCENEKFDFIMMGEVLEHVENPLAFLQKARRLATGKARIFITAPIYAGHHDHIYLFRNTDEIRDMIHLADLKIVDFLEVTSGSNVTLERAIKQRGTILTAFELAV